jgi:hypothetical protein
MTIGNLPELLRPLGTFHVPLPSGGSADLPVCHPTFHPWKGASIAFDYGCKPVLQSESAPSEPLFAELVILGLLMQSGWDGVWVETYGGLHYVQTMPNSWSLKERHVAIPSDKEARLQQIRQKARTKGCFDVFAWRGDEVLFCEAKRAKKDRLTKPQHRFVEGALACGIPWSSFLIVEWSEAP